MKGVIIVFSLEWKTQREFAPQRTLYEKQELAALILQLGYNTPELDKFLVMISGDTHMLAYDSGEYNAYGYFPIFHCSAMDSTPSCKNSGWSATGASMHREQYCHFEIAPDPENAARSCLKFKGFRMHEKLLEFDTCGEGVAEARMQWVEVLKERYADSEIDFEWWQRDMADWDVN